MTEPKSRRVPADWSFAALHAAGAQSISEVREGDKVVALEVRPPVTDAAYNAAASAVVRAGLVAYAADRRWQIETGGINFAGIPVATDDRAKIMIMGARVAAAADPGWETVWHGTDGKTYPLTAVSMIAISSAVEAHVNATFATFAAVKADVDAGKITTVAEIDALFG